jgi:hypothetical protein
MTVPQRHPSLSARSAMLGLLLAGVEGLLSALLVVIVGTTTISLESSAVHILEWSVLTSFTAAIALACLSLPEAIVSRHERPAVRTIYRAVTALTLAICALIASLIVGAA